MVLKSCRDCANFEDRRDMDRNALCALHHGPSVSCQEFTPRTEDLDPDVVYNRFCLNCANFEEIGEVPLCAKIHRPGIACSGFRMKDEVACALT